MISSRTGKATATNKFDRHRPDEEEEGQWVGPLFQFDLVVEVR